MTEIGYFINPEITPLNKINWTELKQNGITAVYVRVFNNNYTQFNQWFLAITGAGLKPYAWIWQGFGYAKYMVDKGWNICMDLETYTMANYMAEVKTLRADTKGKTLIICTKPDAWDGNQRWDLLAPLCDYIMPMLYLGDYHKTNTQLASYMSSYNSKYPGKIYPVLETYVADRNVVPKSTNVIVGEVDTVKPYCRGIGLFRYGLSNYKGVIPVPKPSTDRNVDNINVRIPKANMIAMYKAYKAGFPKIHIHQGTHTGDYVTQNKYKNDLYPRWSAYRNAHGGARPAAIWTLFNPVKPKPTPNPIPDISTLQKDLQNVLKYKFTTYTQFHNKAIMELIYGKYFNNKWNLNQEVKGIDGSIPQNCVDLAQLAHALGHAMGYTVRFIGIYCVVDKINHAYIEIKGKEFGDNWVASDLASRKPLGQHWCSGTKTINPTWSPSEDL